MKHRLEEKMLHSFTLHKKNIRWGRSEKELIIDGRYFDVKTMSKTSNGTVVVTGLYDEEETALNDQMTNTTKQNSQFGNRLIVQFFQLLYASSGSSLNDFTPLSSGSLHFPLFDEQVPASAFTGCLTPPPRG